MIYIILFILLTAFVTFLRALRGPTVAQRVVAADSIGLMLFSLLLLLSSKLQAKALLDIALVYAILQFIDVLVITRHIDCEYDYDCQENTERDSGENVHHKGGEGEWDS